MKTAILSAMAVTLLASTASAEEKREADAHEHGHGMFRMAIEDDHAVIEIEVPAADIVGFEHAPSTAAQRAAIADAAAVLSRPDILFAIPESAGCAIGQVEIGFGATGGHRHEHGDEDHDDHEEHGDDDHAHDDEHDHEEDHDDHAEDDHAGDDHKSEETHSEVTAHYRLACENPAAIDRIEFGYFDAFPDAEELEVVVLSAAGQSAGEVERDGAVFEIE